MPSKSKLDKKCNFASNDLNALIKCIFSSFIGVNVKVGMIYIYNGNKTLRNINIVS